MNLFSLSILKDHRYSRICYDIALNTICYISIFVFLSWDKIFFITKKEGYNPITYFIYIRHEKCLVHDSTSCGCKLNENARDNLLQNIEKSVNIYKAVSQLKYKYK
ncbi:hypothetical protein BCR36DRAFT_326179 [Piromyces finnis]|uniref:Uncharacterized protein n=1 Tax=Piromyces finnis TaxID=1754191 RepID=A0A1Y1VAC1_9FUNG|nr:hypothetical protein BCR36DRAFT_326179 [Piromyces finnis]|eukprot:ORX51107.1 hypothetical protein BCR36DRAFT_326179 [Piromyces finnis]